MREKQAAPRSDSSAFFLLFLGQIAALAACVFLVAHQGPQMGDVFLLVGGMGLSLNGLLLWNRRRAASHSRLNRQNSTPPAEQAAFILGWAFLGASAFFPSIARTVGATGKGHYGALIWAFPMGLVAASGLYSFVQERRNLRRTHGL